MQHPPPQLNHIYSSHPSEIKHSELLRSQEWDGRMDGQQKHNPSNHGSCWCRGTKNEIFILEIHQVDLLPALLNYRSDLANK